ncbi:MAG: uracil-DNA glycosylase [Pseudomonadota bacterium]
MSFGEIDPDYNCDRCPRLNAFIREQRANHSEWFNGPVPSFGDRNAHVLVVGLAPGLQGANRTGRPFTGDYAGDLLYQTIETFGFSEGRYDKHPDDGLTLKGMAITNAVRCVPPQNKPTGAEIKNCRPFLQATIASYSNLKGFLVLGRIAHETLLRTFGLPLKAYPFAHGAVHELENGYTIFDSYHCSRYNTNTGRLTTEMFEDVFRKIAATL